MKIGRETVDASCLFLKLHVVWPYACYSLPNFVPFKCFQFVRELGYVVVARGVSAGGEEQKGRESFEQSFWDSWATAGAGCLGLVLLTVLFFFSTKQLAVNSRAKEASIPLQKKSYLSEKGS